MVTMSPISDQLSDKTNDPRDPRIEYYLRFPQVDFRKKRGWFNTGPSLEFYEIWEEARPTFHLASGKIASHQITDVTQCEIVDAYQWHGHTPAHIMTRDGRAVAEYRPTLWEIAAANRRTGARVIFMVTQASKDEVFRVNYRLNAILSYCREILRGFEQDLAEKGKAPMQELQAALRQSPPRFGF